MHRKMMNLTFNFFLSMFIEIYEPLVCKDIKQKLLCKEIYFVSTLRSLYLIKKIIMNVEIDCTKINKK